MPDRSVQTAILPATSGVANSRGYLATLDGWRAIAILSVIFYHDRLHSLGSLSAGWLFIYGHYGVDLFFAISGVLICWRLLEEEEEFGFISLRGFYVRRAFRILPPALAFLAVVGTLGIAGILSVGFREWLTAVFFCRNYSTLAGTNGYFTEHFWSLAVEEHFYFLLPSLLLFVPKRWRVPSLSAVCACVIIHRFMVLEHRRWGHVLFHTDVRLDALLIPAIFAVLVQSPSVRSRFGRWFRLWPAILATVLWMITTEIGAFWLDTATSLLLPIVVLGTILNAKSRWATWLEWPPLRYVGRISYSLYLWQQLFFVGHFYERFPLGILQSTALRFVALWAIAAGSYHLLERPMIRLGRRLAPPATPGRI
jgi:peptidoglycan/LPS O-acetylase OafA/YrhL